MRIPDLVLPSVRGVEVRVSLLACLALPLVGAAIVVALDAAFPSAPPPILLATSLAILAGLTVSVVAHELGHIAAALALGRRVQSLRFSGIGATTTLSPVPPDTVARAAAGVAIALAGPLVNLVLGAALLAAAPEHDAGLVARALGWLNVLLGAMNLLPGLPMDGGAALAQVVGYRSRDPWRGRIVAGRAGQAVAALLAVLGISVPLFRWGAVAPSLVALSLLLGAGLFELARRATAAAETARRIDEFDLAALIQPATGVADGASLAAAGESARLPGGGLRRVVTMSAGQPAGLVPAAAWSAVPVADWPLTPVRAVAEPLAAWVVVPSSATTAEALEGLRAAPESRWLVVVDEGWVAGLVDARRLYDELLR